VSVQYTPLTQWELELIGVLEGFSTPTWNGPALPRPEGTEGLEEILDTVNKLIARGQYLIQSKDGLSIQYTLNDITATSERFMLGTEEQVQQAADLRGLLTLIESFLGKVFTSPVHVSRIASAFTELRAKVGSRRSRPAADYGAVTAADAASASTAVTVRADIPNADPDYSALTLEDPAQFAMAWTTFEDAYRNGFPHVAEYSAAITEASEATRQFWLTLCSSALPYNLFVLQRLTAATAMSFQNNFRTSWLPEYEELLSKGRLYGIDMTIFSGFDPHEDTNGTLRFTPSTMALLAMDDRKTLTPIAVYVADPKNINDNRTYVQSSPAWIYALLAVKTSLTVYGIWLGHVYTQHIVTAAMQMATLNTLPPSNIIYQLLAPQSQYTIAFDLVLLLAWSNLSPPTSIGDSGKFLTLCNKFSATHDFSSTDPVNTPARLNLDPADFTDPSIDDQPWNLYPNMQKVQQIWQMTADYVGAVVDVGYASDAAVASDTDLAKWITAASGAGNVAGLPRMDSKAALKAVATSVLYRITFHGVGRLRSIGTPLPAFAPNYPPCLQSTTIPDPQTPLSTVDLLRTYLPNTGSLGKLVSFYNIFSFSAPYVPVVPYKGPEDELFFDQAVHPAANQALIQFRNMIQSVIRTLQPDWVQIGQWPRNIEL
jgi:hypothetical protein